MAFDYGKANNQQKKAIQYTEGPLLIIAGPAKKAAAKDITFVNSMTYRMIPSSKIIRGEIQI